MIGVIPFQQIGLMALLVVKTSVKARIPVVAYTQTAKTVTIMMAVMCMVMAAKKGTIIARVMRRVVTTHALIGIQIITMILSIIARGMRCGSTGYSIISLAMAVLAQIIRAG
jgi:hypothetical protein